MMQPDIEHAQETLNRRSLLLRLGKEVWIVPAMTIAGALLGILIYSGIWLSMSGQRQYQQTSKYYLTFGVEENGNAADYYNDYTWNEILFSVPAISDVIEDGLPDDMTMEEAQEAIEAQILSDVRILTIEVTHADPEVVLQLTNAVQDALIRYGKNAIQFENIEYLSSSEVEAVIISDRTRNALLLGAVLGFLISAAGLWLYVVLDDGIYVPEDSLKRYGIPVVGVLGKENSPLPSFLQEETEQAMQKLRDKEHLYLTCEDPAILPGLQEKLEKEFQVHAGIFDADKKEVPTEALLILLYGHENGSCTEHLIGRLLAEDIQIRAALLIDADGKFLAKYYGKR